MKFRYKDKVKVTAECFFQGSIGYIVGVERLDDEDTQKAGSRYKYDICIPGIQKPWLDLKAPEHHLEKVTDV